MDCAFAEPVLEVLQRVFSVLIPVNKLNGGKVLSNHAELLDKEPAESKSIGKESLKQNNFKVFFEISKCREYTYYFCKLQILKNLNLLVAQIRSLINENLRKTAKTTRRIKSTRIACDCKVRSQTRSTNRSDPFQLRICSTCCSGSSSKYELLRTYRTHYLI